MSVPIDLGHGHVALPWHYGEGQPTAGYVIEHPDKRNPSEVCRGTVAIAGVPIPPGFREDRATWELSGEPPDFTLSPSIACLTCGDHGWVRNGQWVPA